MTAWDLTISVPDRPGVLAKLSQELGRDGINIEGVSGGRMDGKAHVQLLVENRDKAREVVKRLGHEVVTEREVLVEKLEDRPGVLGERLQAVADAGINLTTVYLATDTRIVLGAEDLKALREAWTRTATATR